MSLDGNLKNGIKNIAMKASDDSLMRNAENASGVGLETKVIRHYDDVGLHGGKDVCQWCQSREGEWSYDEANSNGVFERHPGCECTIEYLTEKGIQRQMDWQHNTWEDVKKNPNTLIQKAEKLAADSNRDPLRIEAENPFKNPKTPLKIDSYSQSKHIKGGKKYMEYMQTHEHEPSILTITEKEAQKLVEKYHGTGILELDRNGNIINREKIIDNDIVIGYAVNNQNGKKVKATGFKIHYSNKGTHIVPMYENQKEYWKERRAQDGHNWLLRQKN